MAAEDQSQVRKKTSLKKKLLFAIVPVLVLFIAFEMGLRSVDWPKATDKFEHREPFWVVDPDLDAKIFPHKEEGSSFPVSTNFDGLRTKYLPTDKGSKILSMGCSTTFGWGVADSEAYPQQLEFLLQENGHSGISVVNGGQPGYTSFQGHWLWRNTLRKYNPDLVLLGFVVQDARKAAYSDKSQAILQRDHRFLKDNFLFRSRVYLGIRSFLGSVQIRAKERSQNDQGGMYRVPPDNYVENIRALVSEIQAQNGRPILFGYPLERSGYTTRHRKILRVASEELDIPYIDPQEKMENASFEEKYYFEKDPGHANAKGNALIAKWVFENLESEQLLEGL